MKRIFSILIFFVSLFLLAVHPASAAPARISDGRQETTATRRLSVSLWICPMQ